MNRLRFGAIVAALAVLGMVGSGATGAPAHASGPVQASGPVHASGPVGTSYATISGVGSTWSANAIQQWARNVLANYQWKINYNPAGSSAGRQQFALLNGGADFAVSEIPYDLANSDAEDAIPARHFVYMPIVAGGTSFMYNLVIGGKRVTNLRLSGSTVSKIFAGDITKWNDPAIAADNPDLALPAIQIIPVARSDGSGTTAQLTTWMRSQFPSVYGDFCKRAALKTLPDGLCGITSNFPPLPGFKLQSGSDGVAGYVAQPQYVGSITYVEYSYALNSHFPVAKILNQAGYYTEPTPGAVAVALLKAQINQDKSSTNYLTEILGGVYTNPDPRTYPLSSYSYMLVPTALEYGFTLNKGKTLAAFTNYFLCQGQQSADVLGYSALPINLAQAGLNEVLQIPGGDPASVNIKKCNNPTFSSDGSNKLADTAPQPPACDKKGKTQCATGTGGAKNTPTVGSKGSGSAGSSSGGSTSGPSDESSAGDGSSGSGTSDLSSDSRPLTVAGKPTTIPASSVTSGPGLVAAAAAVIVVLAAIFIPPVIARRRALARPRAPARRTAKGRAEATTRKIHQRSGRRARASRSNSTEGS
jgi:phosphate ABC transporter phosphate-binding protein